MQEWTVNDMRLGDLDALYREIKNSDWLPHERINAMKMVREQPTIDAVPVCRRLECKWWVQFGEDSKKGVCDKADCVMYEDDFCSYGERKDGEG